MPRILSIRSLSLPHRYRQEEVESGLEAWLASGAQPGGGWEKWSRLYRRSGVGWRSSVIPMDRVLAGEPLEVRNAYFADRFIQLGAAAVQQSLRDGGWSPAEFHTFITVSCTGFMIPSAEAHIAVLLGFPASIRRLPITELGCAAGAMGLGFAADLTLAEGTRRRRVLSPDLRASRAGKGPGGAPVPGRAAPGVGGGPDSDPDSVPDKSILLAAEFPSLNFQLGDHSPAQMVSSTLFGDGVVAAVVGSDDAEEAGGKVRGPRIAARASHLFPESSRLMGFDLRSSGFHIILSKEIPEVVQGSLGPLVGRFLAGLGWRKEEVRWWVVHPGGEKILQAIEQVMGLPGDALDPSRRVLREWGNTSSAAVLMVLEQAMGQASTGDRGLLMAFGPGFSVEFIALTWD